MWVNPNDVAILIGYNTFSTTTIPTIAQVESIIVLVESEISHFIVKYNIELNDNVNAIIKKNGAMGVAGIILNSYLNNNQTEGSQATYFKNEYKNFITNIKKIVTKTFEPSSNYTDGTIEVEYWKLK